MATGRTGGVDLVLQREGQIMTRIIKSKLFWYLTTIMPGKERQDYLNIVKDIEQIMEEEHGRN